MRGWVVGRPRLVAAATQSTVYTQALFYSEPFYINHEHHHWQREVPVGIEQTHHLYKADLEVDRPVSMYYSPV